MQRLARSCPSSTAKLVKRSFLLSVALAILIGVAPSVGLAAATAQKSFNARVASDLASFSGRSLSQATTQLARQSAVDALADRIRKAGGSGFAGLWKDPKSGRYRIGYTTAIAKARIRRAVAGSSGMSLLDLKRVESSHSDLLDTQQRLVKSVMKRLPAGASSLEVSQPQNAVIIHLRSSVRGAQLKRVQQAASAEPDLVKIDRSSDRSMTMVADGCTFPNCSTPLRGGVKIQSSAGSCTAGFNAVSVTDYSQKFLMTAGHCLRSTGTSSFTATSPPSNDQTIGPGDGWTWNRLGDYGRIRVPSGTYWHTPSLLARVAQWSMNENMAIGGRKHPTPGNVYCFAGSASRLQCGSVTASEYCITGTLAPPETAQTPEPMCGMWLGDSCGAGGDSGGPAWEVSGYAIGLLSGHQRSSAPCDPYPDNYFQSGSAAVFQDVVYAEKQLGLRVITEPAMGLGELPNGKLSVVGQETGTNDLRIWNWNPTFQSTTNPQWAPAITAPGAMGSQPSLASWAAGRLDLFYKSATDNSLMHRSYQDPTGLYAPESLGGGLIGGAGVISRKVDQLDVFVRGTDNAMYQKYWSLNTGWSGWVSHGGVIGSAPAVASWASDRIDLFVKGYNDDQVWHRPWANNQWYGWGSLGGSIDGTPAAVSWGPNRIDVFARDKATGNLLFKAWDVDHWTPWTSWGGPIGSSPAVASWSPGRLDVFAKSPSGNTVMHRAYAGGQLWDWETLPGTGLGGAPAAISW